MKIICRKCGLTWDFEHMTFDDVQEIQEMKCGMFGMHRLLGVAE